jgi:hypothetical protein
MGPGSAGSGSSLGFSGIEVAGALDATTALGGIPIAALRVSFADPRPRHQGVSHHSLTTLSVATRSRVQVALPCVGGVDEAQIRRDLTRTGIDTRHEIIDMAPVGVLALLEADGIAVESMGRPAASDPVLFEAAAAAGVLAAQSRSPPALFSSDARRAVAGRTRPEPPRAPARHQPSDHA